MNALVRPLFMTVCRSDDGVQPTNAITTVQPETLLGPRDEAIIAFEAGPIEVVGPIQNDVKLLKMSNAESPTIFISYSHKDELWKDRLLPHLKALEQIGLLDVWDDRRIGVGEEWYPEIQRAMEQAAAAVCLISADFLSSDFCVKEEIPFLLKRQKQTGMLLLPILIRPCPWELVPWLKALQMFPLAGKSVAVEFADNHDTVFSEMALLIGNKFSKPNYQLPPPTPRWPTLPINAVDISRLPETGSELFGRQEKMNLLDAAWENPRTHIVVVKAWGGVGKSTLVRVWSEAMGEENYRGAQRVFAWSFYSQGTGERVTSADQFIANALEFFGDADPSVGSPWEKGERLAELVAQQRTLLLLDGMEPLQSDLEFDRGTVKDPALQTLLVNLARDNPGLCVITTREDVTDLQEWPLLNEVKMNANEPLRKNRMDLREERFSGAVLHCDLEQVSDEAGRALLRVRDIRGSDEELERAVRQFGNHALAVNLLASFLRETATGDISAADNIADIDVPEDRGKHPRRIVAAFENYFGESPEVQLLRILGLFDRPATAGELAAVTAGTPIPGLTDQLVGKSGGSSGDFILSSGSSLADAAVLVRLRDLGLIAPVSTHRPDILDAHPLIREHFAEQLAGGGRQPTASSKVPNGREQSAGSRPPLSEDLCIAAREAHRRLYEHLTQSAPELPDSLNEMMPLYHAVSHGCKAGLWKEAWNDVYWQRISRRYYFHSTGRLGAYASDLSALNGFFRETWTVVRSGFNRHITIFLFRLVGYRLRALGQTKDAARLLESALDAARCSKDLSEAASCASILSQLYLYLGDLVLSIKYAEESIERADRSKNDYYQMFNRTTLATALHYAGKIHQAEGLLKDAEVLQRKRDTRHPMLHSIEGFRHYELLIDLERYSEAAKRAMTTQPWVLEAQYPLAIGLNYLALGLVDMRKHVSVAEGEVRQAQTHVQRSIEHLRRSSQIKEFTRGLLARVELFRSQAIGSVRGAERDLAETESIAERGSMLIWKIEAALERSRLYLALASANSAPLRETSSRSESNAEPQRSRREYVELAQQKLDEARALIKKTEKPYEPHVPDWPDWEPPAYVGVFKAGEIVGYHRRNDEIKALQAAIDREK